VLLLSFYQGRTVNKFGILIGQIVAIDRTDLNVVLIGRRPGPGGAGRHLPAAAVRKCRLDCSDGQGVVGSLLVVALMVTPAAAAARVAASPWKASVLAVIFAKVAALGGIVLSLAPGKPVSAFVTAISFVIYLGCRLIERIRDRRTRVGVTAIESTSRPASPVSLG
jgi:zinc/manganese transport system permease protein